jgi:HAE1 family hydrophobic/amphiphilic exporter-1
MGKDPLQASLVGSREIGFTIVSMTLSLAAVFIPVLFMGGVVGRMFNEFGLVISMAILISGIVSLTLTPMLCSRMLVDEHKKKHGRLYAASERMFDALLRTYRSTLSWVLERQRLTLAVFFAIIAGTAVLFNTMSKGFLPADDSGQILVFTEAAQDVSFQAMATMQRQVAAIVKENPYVYGAMSSVGAGGPSASLNVGRVFVTLTPRDERPSADAIVQQLRGPLSKVSGIRAYVQNVPAIRIGGQLTKSQYQYTLQGPDTDELYRAAPARHWRVRRAKRSPKRRASARSRSLTPGGLPAVTACGPSDPKPSSLTPPTITKRIARNAAIAPIRAISCPLEGPPAVQNTAAVRPSP